MIRLHGTRVDRSNITQVSELEASKLKATELLRANDGDAVKAMVAYVNAAP